MVLLVAYNDPFNDPFFAWGIWLIGAAVILCFVLAPIIYFFTGIIYDYEHGGTRDYQDPRTGEWKERPDWGCISQWVAIVLFNIGFILWIIGFNRLK